MKLRDPLRSFQEHFPRCHVGSEILPMVTMKKTILMVARQESADVSEECMPPSASSRNPSNKAESVLPWLTSVNSFQTAGRYNLQDRSSKESNSCSHILFLQDQLQENSPPPRLPGTFSKLHRPPRIIFQYVFSCVLQNH
jgi:hypothetical protein